MRLVLLALLAAVVAMLAACGGGQGGGNATALPVLTDLAPVADATKRADSARFELEFSFEVPALGSLAFTADGAYDTPAKKAELTMDLGSFAKLMNGFAGSLGGDAPKGLGDPSKWKLDMRLDGTVAYMRMPFLASELPAGKEWVRVDLAQAARLQGAELGDLQSFAKGGDPRQALEYLRAVAGDVTHVGDETVRGVPTSHYFAVLDWQKLLAQAAAQANEPGTARPVRELRRHDGQHPGRRLGRRGPPAPPHDDAALDDGREPGGRRLASSSSSSTTASPSTSRRLRRPTSWTRSR